MKKTSFLPTATLALALLGLALSAEAAPKLKFDQTVYDFGKTSQVATVTGTFTFKNTGDEPLRLEPPAPSCGCTVAAFKTNVIAPGASGELPFTLNLGQAQAVLEKHIAVRSNDPKTPEVNLTIRVDFTPLFNLEPLTLSPSLPFGTNATDQFTTLFRTDGKPLKISRLNASKPWITATVEPGNPTNQASARIRIHVQREGTPRRFNEYVQIYTEDQGNTPAASVYIYGQILGELSLTPEALYWSITDATKTSPESNDLLYTRRLMIRTAKGEPLVLQSPKTTAKGMKVEMITKEEGVAYELVARLEEIPTNTVTGQISFETSVKEQKKVEVPFVVNVYKP